MDKKQNYHISIKNLVSKRTEHFLLSQDDKNPMSIQGADNIAPRYQTGKMEYGDFTNHSVWSQSDWSEGGGKKFFDAYRDGYNLFPYSKKYFSKRGIRTIDYPGELVLGSSALLVNFPENTGSIAKIIVPSDTRIYAAVNLENRCKIYLTTNQGVSWGKVYDSNDVFISNPGYDYSSEKMTVIKDMVYGSVDPCDKLLRTRTVPYGEPGAGNIIAPDEWDNWNEERVYGVSSIAGLFFLASSVNPVNSYNSNYYTTIFRIGSDGNVLRHGAYLTGQTINVIDVKNDNITEYTGVSQKYYPLVSGYHGVKFSGNEINNFFVGQEVQTKTISGSWQINEIVGVDLNERIIWLKYYIAGSAENIQVRIYTNTKVAIVLDQDPPEFYFYSKDFQGNNLYNHLFDIRLHNQRSRKLHYIYSSCGSKYVSHRNCISNTTFNIGNHSYAEKTRKDSSGQLYHIYQWAPYNSVEGVYIPADNRKYIVVQTNGGIQVGDILKISEVQVLATALEEYDTGIIGIYRRQDQTIRRSDLYYSNQDYLFRRNRPGIDNDDNSLSTAYYLWGVMLGLAQKSYFNSSTGNLFIGSRDRTIEQVYLSQVEDPPLPHDADNTDIIIPMMAFGEKAISGIVEHNERIYIATNDKGRIYFWDGQAFSVLNRFELNPVSNSTIITDAVQFLGKILFIDNFNGNIMSYDPLEDIWDDLGSPEYENQSGDLITSMASVGNKLFIGTNKTNNLMWSINDSMLGNEGELISSWYSADMPAIEKRGLYVQILTQQFIPSKAKIRMAVQFDYEDKWYYLNKERGQSIYYTPTDMQELGYSNYEGSRTFYLFFPYDLPKFKTIRYRIEIVAGEYKELGIGSSMFRPIINNIDVFYILTDPKEIIFPYNIKLEDRPQTLGGYGSNEIGKHRDKLAFLMDIWNNDTMVEITHIDGEKRTCIPFKPEQLTGGGMSVSYQNTDVSRKDLDKLSYFVTMMFKNINKIDTFGK